MTFALAIGAVAWAGSARAQTASTPGPARVAGVGSGPAGISAGIEIRRDRYRYRFENPSSFNTPFTVPHFFAQSYRVNSRWLVVRARYPIFGRLWEFEGGFTTDRSGYGDDYDTFFNPGGNVITYGTSAAASIRSWRLGASVPLARVAGLDTWLGYGFRRDRAVFPPSLTTTTQTQPPSFDSFWNAGRETTISDIHEVRVGAGRSIAISGRAVLGGRLTLTPIGVARLTTKLEDKYPGVPIVFVARGPSLAAVLLISQRVGWVRMTASADFVHTWSYSSANQFHRDCAGAAFSIGF